MRDLDAAGDLKAEAANIPLMRALVLADKGSYEAGARADQPRPCRKGAAAPRHITRAAAVAFEEGRIEAAEEDADRALELDGDFAAAHMLKGRILEERGDNSAARARFDKALSGASESFDGRTTRRVAKERVASGGGAAKDKTKNDDDVAEVTIKKKGPLDCKVFLPSTGSVVTAKCNE